MFFTVTVLFCYAEEPRGATVEKEPREGPFHYSAPHLGTVVLLLFFADSQDEASALSKICFQRIEELDAILSDYRPESELSMLSKKPIGQAHKVSDLLFAVIAQAQAVSEKSGGAFDITLGRHTNAWRKQEVLDVARENQANFNDLTLDPNEQTVTLHKHVQLDLGGIGKGFIADQIMRLLKEAGISRAAIIIGGDGVVSGAPLGKQAWSVGVTDPERKVIGKLELEHRAFSTSGDSYQFFEIDSERLSHLIDPTTKRSKVNRLNVVTLASTGAEADAWATALRVLPQERAITIAANEQQLEALFIPYKQKIRSTKNFPKLHGHDDSK